MGSQEDGGMDRKERREERREGGRQSRRRAISNSMAASKDTASGCGGTRHAGGESTTGVGVVKPFIDRAIRQRDCATAQHLANGTLDITMPSMYSRELPC